MHCGPNGAGNFVKMVHNGIESLAESPTRAKGRGTLQAAIDESVPAPVISAALFACFGSRREADHADRLLSALRFGFGGHAERPKDGA